MSPRIALVLGMGKGKMIKATIPPFPSSPTHPSPMRRREVLANGFSLFAFVPTRIENFCASQTPVAYLFLLRLVGWLGSLHPGVKLDRPPLSGDVMRIGTLGPRFTTTAPLVNLAWGDFDFFFFFSLIPLPSHSFAFSRIFGFFFF